MTIWKTPSRVFKHDPAKPRGLRVQLQLALELHQTLKGIQELLKRFGGQHDGVTPSSHVFGDPIAAIESLSDPKKLKTLKPEARGVNGRMDKILFFLYVAEQKEIKPDQVITQAFAITAIKSR